MHESDAKLCLQSHRLTNIGLISEFAKTQVFEQWPQRGIIYKIILILMMIRQMIRLMIRQ